jgi:hypothetical protein
MEKASVEQLAERVGTTLAQAEKQLPTPLIAKAGARPKVRLFLADGEQNQSLLPGVRQALARGGFDVVEGEQDGALRLQVGLRLGDTHAGLRQGEVSLSEVGKASSVYRATLPANPQAGTLAAVGEAAITANVGNLREWVAANHR